MVYSKHCFSCGHVRIKHQSSLWFITIARLPSNLSTFWNSYCTYSWSLCLGMDCLIVCPPPDWGRSEPCWVVVLHADVTDPRCRKVSLNQGALRWWIEICSEQGFLPLTVKHRNTDSLWSHSKHNPSTWKCV